MTETKKFLGDSWIDWLNWQSKRLNNFTEKLCDIPFCLSLKKKSKTSSLVEESRFLLLILISLEKQNCKARHNRLANLRNNYVFFSKNKTNTQLRENRRKSIVVVWMVIVITAKLQKLYGIYEMPFIIASVPVKKLAPSWQIKRSTEILKRVR